jgi:hypothetical protein
MTDSDRVRTYVKSHYIQPARKAGSGIVTVRVGEVRRALNWDLRKVPQVCSALSTKKFMRSAGVELVERMGPPSGQSTTVAFTFRLVNDEEDAIEQNLQQKPIPNGAGLLELYGILADTFRELGGGEAYLKAERDWGPDVWARYELEEKERLAKEKVEKEK